MNTIKPTTNQGLWRVELLPPQGYRRNCRDSYYIARDLPNGKTETLCRKPYAPKTFFSRAIAETVCAQMNIAQDRADADEAAESQLAFVANDPVISEIAKRLFGRTA